MVTGGELPLGERIFQLLQHLGIERAHFAALETMDWSGFAEAHPESILSLTLVCPRGVDAASLGVFGPRLLVITGNEGRPAEVLLNIVSRLPDVTVTTLNHHSNLLWADVVADRTEAIGSCMIDFLARVSQEHEVSIVLPSEGEGSVAGISYRIVGTGPPLVLLPLGLAPSQWELLIPRLSQQYCTITLGGAELGPAALLEGRARSGYRPLVRNLFEELGLQPGETILDVGCGSGAHDRYLAQLTGGRNPITAVDHSPYMIKEAKGIARTAGIEGAIDFHEGDAVALSFHDNSFDVVMSVTVMEEVNAEKMVGQLVRVTKPGGKIGVIVRSVDMPWLVNLPVSASIKQKVEAPGVMGGERAEAGCADASLYTRFHRAGLTQIKMFPQFASFNGGQNFERWKTEALSVLTDDEAEEWHAALAQAEAGGTFFIGQPLHCVVGTKP